MTCYKPTHEDAIITAIFPDGRVGEAGDIICFLASARASYITGASINVDGGTSPVV